MKEGDAEYISHLKLQKLLYYAQGVFLGFYDTVLFEDDLVAWEHGPVVEEVYHEYKSYGKNGIDAEEVYSEKYTKEEEEVLEIVYNNFAQYSAWRLRNMTHEERPWKETGANGVICTDLIKEFFKEEYVDND